MQEREKRRIVIASILKPVDDTRMLGKMGGSLARRENLEVSIMGFGTSPVAAKHGIRLIPLGPFPRLSFRRWVAKWLVFLKTAKVNPHLFIFTTHELLLPAIALKVLFNTKIIYDVRENYYRNIRHSESLYGILRFPVAAWVRLKEKLLAPAVDHFFLAEKGYEKEFNFHRGGWTVIENKALQQPEKHRKIRQQGKIQLLFSGTLAESTGVFRAIELAKALYALNKDVRLIIAGFAATHWVRERIKKETSGQPFIVLVGLDRLVPHDHIEALVLESDAGIIAYPASEQVTNSVPTKLYEYLQGSLPVILEKHWPWIDQYANCQPFMFYDFAHPHPGHLLDELATRSFYLMPSTGVSWDSEEPKLLEAVRNMI